MRFIYNGLISFYRAKAYRGKVENSFEYRGSLYQNEADAFIRHPLGFL